MTPSLRLCVCLCLLLSMCAARPNWHQRQGGTNENDNMMLQKQTLNQNQYVTVENFNYKEKTKTNRPARQVENPLFFGASFSLGGHSNFNNQPQFHFNDRQNFGPSGDHQQFGPPGLHPIGQLASNLQNIINSHLEATIQHNKAVHFGIMDNVFKHPPGLQPSCPLCSQTQTFSHSYGETSHQLDIGPPQVISSVMHVEQVEITCDGENGCGDAPVEIHPNPAKEVNPTLVSSEDVEGIAESLSSSERPSTTERQELVDDKEAEIVYASDGKDSKTLGSEDEAGIDIRFGGGEKSEDSLPSES